MPPNPSQVATIQQQIAHHQQQLQKLPGAIQGMQNDVASGQQSFNTALNYLDLHQASIGTDLLFNFPGSDRVPVLAQLSMAYNAAKGLGGAAASNGDLLDFSKGVVQFFNGTKAPFFGDPKIKAMFDAAYEAKDTLADAIDRRPNDVAADLTKFLASMATITQGNLSKPFIDFMADMAKANNMAFEVNQASAGLDNTLANFLSNVHNLAQHHHDEINRLREQLNSLGASSPSGTTIIEMEQESDELANNTQSHARQAESSAR
jgi:hypothetical protein